MRAVMLMFDSLNRQLLPPYGGTDVSAPNFARLAERAVTFDRFYAGSLPTMPARRELHTGRHHFLHRGWGPLEPFDDSMPALLDSAGIHTHLTSDQPHYWEDGGATYHTRYTTWEIHRGQEGDPWKGVVDSGVASMADPRAAQRRQDDVNRQYMATEADHAQTRTVDAGIHFLETNHDAGGWFLHIELFDPHEPFFSPDHYRKRYEQDDDGPRSDWPTYQKVVEDAAQVDHVRREYAALLSMCDHSLGRLLDVMDEHDMWADTMLVVNTDHGFSLGEHGWWAKTFQPHYQELVHLPMFLWDPRTGRRGERCDVLAQTIDIAPTLLGFFGQQAPADMQGTDLAGAVGQGTPVRDGALFGMLGGHVNVTDGRHVYMRSSATEANGPIEEYTLMPTRMRSRFSVQDLRGWEPAEPFGFTKGVRTMRIAPSVRVVNSWRHGTMLFDVENDAAQERPVIDDDVELRLAQLLHRRMRESEAPASQYVRLGLPESGDLSAEHLLVRAHAERSAESAAPLPTLAELPVVDLLQTPLRRLLGDRRASSVIEKHLPELIETEPMELSPTASLLGLARGGSISAAQLVRVADDLAKVLRAP
ncbi:sulfatase-like hydrolase/transferase [Jiangella endophytica]|uniref:sulfatase-like hydrolase/transferase n=1 Tax=Jiangella endophytica TaxID=1623398 RepID=UPI000E34F059|nr:sulfatase [Jiangella endophytica]